MKEKSSPFKSSSMKSGLNQATSKLSSSTSSQRKMNGFSTTEDDSRDSGHGQICCLVDDSQRCTRPAGNACYSKRIAKTVQQRKLKLTIDHSVSMQYMNLREGDIGWEITSFYTITQLEFFTSNQNSSAEYLGGKESKK